MSNTRRSAAMIVAGLIASLALITPVRAQNNCLAGKTKCASKKTAGLLACYTKAQRAGVPVDMGCLQKVRDKFDGGADPTRGCFARLEAKNDGPCVTIGDTNAIETTIDHCVAAVEDGLTTAPPSPIVTPTPGLTTTPTPTAHATPGPVNNRRCTGNPRTTCVSDGDCAAVGGTCEFWLGGTLPLSGGGVSTCLTNQFNGPISGTYDVDTGASAGSWQVISRVYSGPTLAQPCPACVGDVTPNDGVADGTCQNGQNNGQGCDTNGSSAAFGPTSLDCPPLLAGGLIAALAIDLSNTTGSDTMTLSAANPMCRAVGFTSDRCFCDTCNSPAAEPCSTDADCPDPPGPIGPICGGRRCLSGPNTGAACTITSECPSGACAIPGAATAPNQCDDAVCAPNGGNEGSCNGGPFEQYCGPTETSRGCASNADCPRPGDTCSIGKFRDCYTDNGVNGSTVSATGVASAPVSHQADVTLASLHCVGPTRSAAVNASTGLPGLERLELPWHATDNGTGGSCPSEVELFSVAGGLPVLDRGWTGLAHDAMFPTEAVVTVAVTGCTGSPPSCGSCSYIGPIPNGP